MSEPTTEMTAEEVLEILDLFDVNGIYVWLDGGWNVDALLGEQTRHHKDLDMVVALGDVPRMLELLAADGFEVVLGAPPKNFVLEDAGGRQLDFHPVRWDAVGNGIYRMDNDEDWAFPAEGFSRSGVINGRNVKCLTPEVLMLCRAGYVWQDKDHADTAAIHARFGAPYPLGYGPRDAKKM
jgi:lincosamide nucleotidyltransferase A/C/D/E